MIKVQSSSICLVVGQRKQHTHTYIYIMHGSEIEEAVHVPSSSVPVDAKGQRRERDEREMRITKRREPGRTVFLQMGMRKRREKGEKRDGVVFAAKRGFCWNTTK